MLVLSRKLNEEILIGSVVVTVVSIHDHRVRLGIEAPANIKITRGELLSDAPAYSTELDKENNNGKA